MKLFGEVGDAEGGENDDAQSKLAQQLNLKGVHVHNAGGEEKEDFCCRRGGHSSNIDEVHCQRKYGAFCDDAQDFDGLPPSKL